jgi:hypothetical protein
VGVQRHTLVDELHGNSLGTHSTDGWVGPQGPSVRVWKLENYSPEGVLNPEPSSA